MEKPEVLCYADGYYRRMIFGLGAYIVDYPEQVILGCVVQGWCPMCIPKSLWKILQGNKWHRCTASNEDLNGRCGWWTHELMEVLMEAHCKISYILLLVDIYAQHIQWLTKLSQCLVLFDYSLNSFECKTFINKVLVHQRKNLIRGDEDMDNSNQGPIDSVLWEGIREIVSCNSSTWYCPP